GGPRVRDRPVVAPAGTAPPARGVAGAANYGARQFGVHSAPPLATAHRRCPQAVLLQRDLDLYRRASAAVMGILGRYSDCVEVAGLDEAYLDLSGSAAPKARMRELKRTMLDETRLACSGGLAPGT